MMWKWMGVERLRVSDTLVHAHRPHTPHETNEVSAVWGY